MTSHDVGNVFRSILATVALVLLLISDFGTRFFVIGIVLWLVGSLWTSYRVAFKKGRLFRGVRIGTYTVARLLLGAGVLAVMAHDSAQFTTTMWIGAGASVMLTSVEGVIRRARMYPGIRVANLPNAIVRPPSELTSSVYLVSALLTPFLLMSFAFLAVSDSRTAILGVFWILPVAISGAAGLLLIQEAWLRRNNSRKIYDELPARVEELAPKFVFYWDAPRGTAYQVGMWVPYLKRIGEPFFIMVRNPNTFAQAASVSDDVPVILARTMADMDRLVPESLTTAFYSNNGAKNAHFVRYPQLTHVQLLHGDSDKASSFNPITAMFDRIYVAGQAGIDRYYNNGVDIPLEKFRIVGRPQVEEIMPGTEPIGEKPNPVVLYAPTWRGAYSDASYSSLPIAEDLFDELLKLGCSVIFRPHPYCMKDAEYRAVIAALHAKLDRHADETGTRHIYGEEAEKIMSVTDCFNACDAMISDVSSVVVDFLYSEKPFGLVSMGKDAKEFVEEFPLAEVSYVLTEDRSGWAHQLDSLLRSDPMTDQRRGMRVHYLGAFPSENYAEGFVDVARRQVHTREKKVSSYPTQ